MVRIPIKKLVIESKEILVLDGGQGTELENRGIEVANPVWSTIPFLSESFWTDSSSKERKIVESVFDDFKKSGSNILMTITYQTSFTSIVENTQFKTLAEYNTLLDRIVKFSRSCIGDERYLIGSVGPWGAHVCCEFTGNYGLHPESIDYYEYFKPQLDNFNGQDEIDLIGFETVPNFHELKAILSWDETKIAKPFYIGLSVHNNGVLRDGTTMEEIGEYIKGLGDKISSNFLLLGVNCVSFNDSSDMVKSIHKALPDMPLLAYPNSGEVYDTEKKIWFDNKDKLDSWDSVVRSYIDNGARIIGGCCRTSPRDIAEVSAAVKKYSKVQE